MSVEVGHTIGRYRVIRRLGAGGMGEVWLAQDERLGRPVALKRPSPTVSGSPTALARLQREARHAARLQHRAVAGVHDIIDLDEGSFIVMEYVEGTDLSQILRSRSLTCAEAIDLAVEICDAVAAAHAQGIVHRDLKPGNVRVMPDGQPKVLDFGLSHAPPVSSDPASETVAHSVVTEQGLLSGTPGYSAPEQLLGQPADHRADIFSLGALIYEMVTGVPVFGGRDALSRSMATLSAPTPSVRDKDTRLPAALDEVLARALAKDPVDRYNSAADLRDKLRAIRSTVNDASGGERPSPFHLTSGTVPQAVQRSPQISWAGAAIAVLVAGAIVAFVLARPSPPASSGQSQTVSRIVAVMTPANLTGDPANDVVSVGFADSLFNDLAGMPALTVVPPEEVRQEADRLGSDRQGLVRSLGATYLVESSIQQSGSELRVNARLLAADGRVAWRRDFSGDAARVFDLQRRVAEGLLEGLEIRMEPDARTRIGAGRTTNVVALTDYWRGRTLLDSAEGADQLAEAVSAMESAVARAPDYAEAHAGLGQAYWTRYGITREVRWAQRALEASERALALDPEQPRVWVTLALVHHGTGQSERALEDLGRAVDLQPNSDDAFRLLGDVLSDQGRDADAVAAYDRTIEIRPGYWRNHQSKGVFLFRKGRFTEAETAFRSVIRLQPDVAAGHSALGAVLQSVGELDGARESYEKALAIRPSTAAYSNLGVILHWQGRYQDAIAAYQRASELRPRYPLYHRNIGDAYMRLGDTVKARASYGVSVSLLEEELRVNPKDTVTLTELAYCQAKLGHLAQARQRMEEAAAIDSNSGDVLFGQAVLAALAGRYADALPLVQRAVEQGASLQVVDHDDDLAPVRALEPYRAWRASRAGSSAGGETVVR